MEALLMPQVIPVIIGGLLVAFVVLLCWVAALHRRLSRLQAKLDRWMTGASGVNLEAVLEEHLSRLKALSASTEEMKTRIEALERGLRGNLRSPGVVRFNPFPDTGGDQSFAVAFVDGHGNGVVITSLHSRTETRVYAKPLRDWGSDYALSEEEKEAISRARRQRASQS